MNFFTRYAPRWEQNYGNTTIIDGEPKVETFEDAYILPLKKLNDSTADGLYCGGLLDRDRNFRSGLRRDRYKTTNWDCQEGYEVPDEVEYADETVIFGGVVIDHFGHLLIESLVRFWYFCGRTENRPKVVFLGIPGQDFPGKRLFELAGLAEGEYEFIKRPMQFKKVICPEEGAYFSEAAAYRIWPSIYQTIRHNAEALCEGRLGTYEKLYLTRTQLEKAREFNEEYFEDTFKENGYHVIATEKLPLEEQICLVSHAKEIACTIGTLSHMALFADEGIRLCCILRNPNEMIRGQLLINKIRDLDASIVEGTKNFLPVMHPHGVFLYCGTEYLKAYFDKYQMKYDESLIDDEEVLRRFAYDYLKMYAEYFVIPENYVWIKNRQMLDAIESLQLSLYNKQLDRDELRSQVGPTRIGQLEQKVRERDRTIKAQKKEIASIKANIGFRAQKKLAGLVHKLKRR